MSAFADTSGFVAVLHDGDTNHSAAARAWRRLIEESELIVSTNYVVVETISLLQRRFGMLAVRRFVERILPSVSTVWVDPNTHERAVTIVASGSRESPSLVDTVSFEILVHMDSQRVFAYDRHFHGRGYDFCI